MINARYAGVGVAMQSDGKSKPISDEERLERYRKFVNAIEMYTDVYDDFCDCETEETHKDDCMTMNFRRDADRCEDGE